METSDIKTHVSESLDNNVPTIVLTHDEGKVYCCGTVHPEFIRAIFDGIMQYDSPLRDAIVGAVHDQFGRYPQ